MKSNKNILFAVAVVLTNNIKSSKAFVPLTPLTPFVQQQQRPSTSVLDVGGKGWENNNYLDSLGGNDEDREKAQQEYSEFHASRQAFLKRQNERRQTPEGQKFLRQQEQQQDEKRRQYNSNNNNNEDGEGDFFANLGDSSGGSRFRRLMQQAQRNEKSNQRTSFIDPATGLEMKFAVPLEEDEDLND